jgi:tape measure domain-containing protein
MSITSEIRLRIKKEGDVALTQLSAKLNDVASRSVVSNKKFKDLAATLKQNDSQIRTKSINGLNDYARAWRELANSVDITTKEFKEATAEAQRFERQAAKAQGRRGQGRAMGIAKGVGGVLAGGIFGGPEGLIGGALGLPFGPGGVAAGAAFGATVGTVRQQLGGLAEYSAGLAKQRLALKLVTKDAAEYQRALKFISTTSKDLAIPQDILTRQFTKLSASVIGAGGDVSDAETAFIGVAAGIRGTGGSLQDLDSALTATSQVFSKGKVSAEELRQQIGERLPGAFTLFASSLEMTPAQLDKALEKGEVSLQDFQTFALKLFKEYGVSAKVLADSPMAAGDRLTTALSEMSATVGQLLAPIGAAFQSTFADIANAINGAAKAFIDFFGLTKADHMARLTQRIGVTVERLTAFDERRAKIAARGGDTSGIDARIKQFRERLTELTDEYYSLQKIDAAIESGRKTKPGLPKTEPTTPGGDRKDISPALRAAREAAAAEMAPFRKLELDYAAKKLAIEQSNLKVNEKAAKLAELKRAFDDKARSIGEQISSGLASRVIKQGEIAQQQEKVIQNLEIEAGIIDQKQAQQIQKEQLIQQLQKDGRNLTEEQLARIDEAYEKLNKKQSESQKLAANIVTTFAQGMGDALISLIDKAKSFREVMSDLLKQIGKMLINFGMQALGKGLFPSLFSMGGIMSQRGPVPLRKYARGGIANSPQLAMFGEGSTPEAYVPLPDGRSIPVKVKDGGSMGNITVNVDASGSQVQGDQPNANKLGEALGAAVRQELIRQKRPGGLLS